MTNNQEKIMEIERKIKKYLKERYGNYELLAYQVAFLDGLRILERNQENNLEGTGFPPY
ncbi:12320_t:CDS:2, partial [Racocetra persica]